MQINPSPSRSGNHRGHIILLCTAGVFINFIGAHVARWLDLPLFLDIIGTALAGKQALLEVRRAGRPINPAPFLRPRGEGNP